MHMRVVDEQLQTDLVEQFRVKRDTHHQLSVTGTSMWVTIPIIHEVRVPGDTADQPETTFVVEPNCTFCMSVLKEFLTYDMKDVDLRDFFLLPLKNLPGALFL